MKRGDAGSTAASTGRRTGGRAHLVHELVDFGLNSAALEYGEVVVDGRGAGAGRTSCGRRARPSAAPSEPPQPARWRGGGAGSAAVRARGVPALGVMFTMAGDGVSAY